MMHLNSESTKSKKILTFKSTESYKKVFLYENHSNVMYIYVFSQSSGYIVTFSFVVFLLNGDSKHARVLVQSHAG